MSKIWLELKYGQGAAGLTVCRLDNERLLRVFKQTALDRAEGRLHDSELIDPVVAIIDRFDLQKLRTVLDALIPDTTNSGGNNRG
ncbi:MAG: hypothetical protein ACOC6F_02250 [bacterium]